MEWLSADEAARRLNIRLDSLYAYVSRGLIHSEREGGGRARRYRAADVEALSRKQRVRRDPESAARDALHWGVPVLDSQVSSIRDGVLSYRGVNVGELARQRTFEQVVALLWTGDSSAALPDDPPPEPPAWDTIREMPVLQRLAAAVALAAPSDLPAYDLREPAVLRTSARVLRLVFSCAAGKRRPLRVLPGHSLAEGLARGWGCEQGPLLEQALILCADHELNVSAFTARCVASAAASPYAAVLGGLAAMQGARHGGSCEMVEGLFDQVDRPGEAKAVLAGRLRRGEPLAGFGHPLYPDGDPRARFLLDGLDALGGKAVRRARALAEAGREIAGEHPNIDFALVSLARACELAAGASTALFALGRTAGWLAHVMEQYRDGRLIRPRAG
ncbi:MAG: helix-turn-helix domain-containing protein [Armatimonadetes bacterium]|nr:helix-turn-helix domain-containing protein [Armatimonadota bacterium]